jgi:hypothetical protein
VDSYSTSSSDNIGDVTQIDSESSCERDRSKTIVNEESCHIDENTSMQIHNSDDYSLTETELSPTSSNDDTPELLSTSPSGQFWHLRSPSVTISPRFSISPELNNFSPWSFEVGDN